MNTEGDQVYGEIIIENDSPVQTVSIVKNERAFYKDVLKLVGGTSVAQILNALLSPVLSRLYSPAAFGVLQLFTSVVLVGGLVACLRYDNAIMLPKGRKEAMNLLALSMLVAFLFSCATGLFLFFFGPVVLTSLKASELIPYSWLMVLFVFFAGLFNAFNYWNSRTRHYARLSYARILNYGSMLSYQTVAGFLKQATSGNLIIGFSVSTILASIFLFFRILIEDWRNFVADIDWREIVMVLKKYKKFPLIDTWSTLFNSLSWQLPAFVLSYFFTKDTVGFYSLSYRVISLPMMLVGASLGQVFFQHSSALHAQNQSLASTVETMLRRLVALGLAPAILMLLAGKEMFMVVFGANWGEAGIYVQILSIWFIVWFISSPISSLFSVFQHQEKLLLLNLLILITRFLSLLIGGIFHNVYMGLVLFSVSGVALYGYLVIWGMRQAGVPLNKITSLILHYSVYLVPVLLVVVTKYWLHASPWIVLASVMVSGLVYYSLIAQREGLFTLLRPQKE